MPKAETLNKCHGHHDWTSKEQPRWADTGDRVMQQRVCKECGLIERCIVENLSSLREILIPWRRYRRKGLVGDDG